jgi:hypothetical protein
MPALVAGIHVFLAVSEEGVDGRDKPGHDSRTMFNAGIPPLTTSLQF